MPKPPDKKDRNPIKNLAILSGIAIEMGVIIYLFARGGMWLDSYYATEKRIFTAIATLLGVGISLWVVLRQIKQVKY
ncbi:AtpZ/AtpI family protein [Robiginitalea sp. IMCC44478]|uniref:AtpZ/AtpI family protein n=1 Tax=Robiginitalea sp. IMCC44478 TaxID=3459122 RepID=UPI004043491C